MIVKLRELMTEITKENTDQELSIFKVERANTEYTEQSINEYSRYAKGEDLMEYYPFYSKITSTRTPFKRLKEEFAEPFVKERLRKRKEEVGRELTKSEIKNIKKRTVNYIAYGETKEEYDEWYANVYNNMAYDSAFILRLIADVRQDAKESLKEAKESLSELKLTYDVTAYKKLTSYTSRDTGYYTFIETVYQVVRYSVNIRTREISSIQTLDYNEELHDEMVTLMNKRDMETFQPLLAETKVSPTKNGGRGNLYFVETSHFRP